MMKIPVILDCFKIIPSLRLVETQDNSYIVSHIEYHWDVNSNYKKEKYCNLTYIYYYEYKGCKMRLILGDHTCSWKADRNNSKPHINLEYNVHRTLGDSNSVVIQTTDKRFERHVKFDQFLTLYIKELPNELVFDKKIKYKDISDNTIEWAVRETLTKQENKQKIEDIINSNRKEIEKYMIQFMQDVDASIELMPIGTFR